MATIHEELEQNINHDYSSLRENNYVKYTTDFIDFLLGRHLTSEQLHMEGVQESNNKKALFYLYSELNGKDKSDFTFLVNNIRKGYRKPLILIKIEAKLLTRDETKILLEQTYVDVDMYALLFKAWQEWATVELGDELKIDVNNPLEQKQRALFFECQLQYWLKEDEYQLIHERLPAYHKKNIIRTLNELPQTPLIKGRLLALREANAVWVREQHRLAVHKL